MNLPQITRKFKIFYKDLDLEKVLERLRMLEKNVWECSKISLLIN